VRELAAAADAVRSEIAVAEEVHEHHREHHERPYRATAENSHPQSPALPADVTADVTADVADDGLAALVLRFTRAQMTCDLASGLLMSSPGGGVMPPGLPGALSRRVR
jgi:hypothetical protein